MAEDLTPVAPTPPVSSSDPFRGEVAKEPSEEEKKPPRAALLCLIFVNIVEGVDSQLIPGCLFALPFGSHLRPFSSLKRHQKALKK